MKTTQHLMVDIETLSTSVNALITQIGACYFDIATGAVGKTFLINLDVYDGIKCGFDVDPVTVEWWKNQSIEAIKGLFDPKPVPVIEGLNAFSDFTYGRKVPVWSHATFDFVRIMNYYSTVKARTTLHFRNAMDLRTLTMLAGTVNVSGYHRGGVHHNALDDCLYQVKYATDCYNAIMYRKPLKLR